MKPPIVIRKPEEPKTSAPEQIDQRLVDAVLMFMRKRESGVLEIHFSQGGVAKVYSNVKQEWK